MNKRVILVIGIFLVIPLCAMNDDDNDDIEMGTVRSNHSDNAPQTPEYEPISHEEDNNLSDSLGQDHADPDFIHPDDDLAPPLPIRQTSNASGSYDHLNDPFFVLIRQMIENNRITVVEARKLRLTHQQVVAGLHTLNSNNEKLGTALQATATQHMEIGKAIQESLATIAKDHTQVAAREERKSRDSCAQAYLQPCVTGTGLAIIFFALLGNSGLNDAIYSTRNELTTAIYNVKPACYCMCPACPTIEFPTPAPANTGSDNASYLNDTYNPSLSTNTTEFMAMISNMTNNTQ